MPSKYVVREKDTDAYYHVFNRGAWKRPVFLDDQDRLKFLSLLARHLDPADVSTRSDGLPYPKYNLELLAYCLMDNHFHLLIYQRDDPEAISGLLKSICTAYAMYFNHKYRSSGRLFQGLYKSSRIIDEEHLAHIARYIHMNPRYYLRYAWSSIRAYLGEPAPSWLKPMRIQTMTPQQYRKFLADYDARKAELEALKDLLAR